MIGWRAVLGIVRERSKGLASVLEHAALLRFDRERVALGWEANSFLVGEANGNASRELLSSALQRHFGAAPAVVFETIASKDGSVSVHGIESAERKARVETARRAVAQHPLVAAAIELLGAELRDVRLSEAAEGP
jgi:DNA polymerase III subunit gamma/tau